MPMEKIGTLYLKHCKHHLVTVKRKTGDQCNLTYINVNR